jgi:hypothetical protein
MKMQQKNKNLEKSVKKSNAKQEHAALTFSGYIKVFDPNTKQVFVEKRS